MRKRFVSAISVAAILERFKRGQRVNLQRHMDQLKVEQQEAVTFVESVMASTPSTYIFIVVPS